jgi:phage terminase Nu1 subunit (DNA packaging protein)
MNDLIVQIKAFNPNNKTTFFMHKNYTDYLANSEFAIKNDVTSHGLFGYVKEFPHIEKMENLEPIINHVNDLAKNKVPIWRGLISFKEYDAIRLGYTDRQKFKELLESKLDFVAKKLDIKYEDLQYCGAVHLEKGHPHLQFFFWSKSRDKSNYFVHFSKLKEIRESFVNAVYREDLIPIYNEKDIAKQNILAENYIISQLKELGYNKNFIKDVQKYENGFSQKKIMKHIFRDDEMKNIIVKLVDLSKDLRQTTGSIKYEYLKKYPDILAKVDAISKDIINSSIECQEQKELYILAKQRIEEFKYSDEDKLELAQKQVRIDAEKEIIKLVGNKILDFERKLLNENTDLTETQYINRTKDWVFDLYGLLCAFAYMQDANCKKTEIKYRKELSKQAKKEKARDKRISSSWEWNCEK